MKILIYGINYIPEADRNRQVFRRDGRVAGCGRAMRCASSRRRRTIQNGRWRPVIPHGATSRNARRSIYLAHAPVGAERSWRTEAHAAPVLLRRIVVPGHAGTGILARRRGNHGGAGATCARAGWLAARLGGGKAWLHIQDFEVDVAFHMGMLKGHGLKRLVRGLNAGARPLRLRFLDLGTHAGTAAEKIRRTGTYQFFPNWVDINHVSQLTGPSSYRAELGIAPDAIVALFSGTMGGKQGLMVIPQAARLLATRKDVVFVICGNGVMKQPLETATAGLPNVRMLPLQPFERLAELLGMADIHLLPQSRKPKTWYSRLSCPACWPAASP